MAEEDREVDPHQLVHLADAELHIQLGVAMLRDPQSTAQHVQVVVVFLLQQLAKLLYASPPASAHDARVDVRAVGGRGRGLHGGLGPSGSNSRESTAVSALLLRPIACHSAAGNGVGVYGHH